MNFIIAASTDIGNTKSTNQDSFHARVLSTAMGKMLFVVLCDGMGGLSKGEVASSSLVTAFVKWSDHRLPELIDSGLSEKALTEDWNRLLLDYNEKIKQYGKQIGSAVGTTATVLLVTEKRFYIANVGDTRAYEISDTVRVLTKDQTVVAKEVEQGLLTEEQAHSDSRRSVLLQCIGASDVVYPDFFAGDAKLNAVYILCTDGFRHEITPDEIYNYLNPNVMLSVVEMKQRIDTLIDLNKQRAERDNITVVVGRTF